MRNTMLAMMTAIRLIMRSSALEDMQCHSITSATTDSWCQLSCRFNPRNCPATKCTCRPSGQALAPQGLRPSPSPPTPHLDACLCVFDVDRTLTGKQGAGSNCPQDEAFPGIFDDSYDGGSLLLSDLGQHVLDTFCGSCYIGIVSAGDASGPGSKERSVLLEQLTTERTLTDQWSGPEPVTSSLVTWAQDKKKQISVQGIVDWFRLQKNVTIANEDVHFFDDRPDNVEPFTGTGFNARQVSCQSRDSNLYWGHVLPMGLCGAVTTEVIKATGVTVCSAQTQTKAAKSLSVDVFSSLFIFIGIILAVARQSPKGKAFKDQMSGWTSGMVRRNYEKQEPFLPNDKSGKNAVAPRGPVFEDVHNERAVGA
eukprot:gnl/MRDRNA2_/MRDRNA2_30068_c0_seq1.p1 gnl/MRDRNA2_/MRDRNA2_30068_c0~~gnl/MRDRNA2_/MRDRNA2_30068_c0_seq1.p1  ORF type:complete len:367 (+),score=46.16 gnl/MRDRNA2_/MRDRNA2_30068_c0_seq1:111-1211(+)